MPLLVTCGGLTHSHAPAERQEVLCVANELFKEAGKALSHIQIQKLLYFAQGVSLAIAGKSLLQAEFQAWKFGPVVDVGYHALKVFDDQNVPHSQFLEEFEIPANLAAWCPPKHVRFAVALTVAVHRRHSASRLVDISHESGSPWKQKFSASLPSVPIGNDLIEEFFRSPEIFFREVVQGAMASETFCMAQSDVELRELATLVADTLWEYPNLLTGFEEEACPALRRLFASTIVVWPQQSVLRAIVVKRALDKNGERNFYNPFVCTLTGTNEYQLQLLARLSAFGDWRAQLLLHRALEAPVAKRDLSRLALTDDLPLSGLAFGTYLWCMRDETSAKALWASSMCPAAKALTASFTKNVEELERMAPDPDALRELYTLQVRPELLEKNGWFYQAALLWRRQRSHEASARARHCLLQAVQKNKEDRAFDALVSHFPDVLDDEALLKELADLPIQRAIVALGDFYRKQANRADIEKTKREANLKEAEETYARADALHRGGPLVSLGKLSREDSVKMVEELREGLESCGGMY